MTGGGPLSVTVAVDFGGSGPRAGGGREACERRADPPDVDVEDRPRRWGGTEAPEPRRVLDEPGAAEPIDRPPCRAARLLALAKFVEYRIDADDLRDLADAAERSGITRARMTQIANLALLAPDFQEGLLLGRRAESERRLRGAVGEAVWDRQRALSARLSRG